MAEKKYISLARLEQYNDKIVAKIAADDAATLKAAKDYSDSLAENYEKSGSVATAQATLQGNIDAVDGKVTQNTNAIAAINNETTGILATAKGYTDIEVGKVQNAVDTLDGVVGDLPTDGGYTSVVDMITKKTANIASSDTVSTLTDKVAEAEKDIAALEGLVGETKVETQISNAITALDLANTYEAKGAAKAVQGDTTSTVKAVEDSLGLVGGRVGTLEDQIKGLTGAMHFEGVKDELPTDVSGYEAGDVIIVGDKEYVFNNGAFVEFGDVSAEGERLTALETHKTTYEAKVNTLEVEMDDVQALAAAAATQTALAEAIQTLEGADAKQVERIAALEGKFGGADGSVEDLIADAQAAAEAHADSVAATKASEAQAAAISHANTELAKDRARLDALEAIDHDHSNKSVLDGITAEKVTAWDDAATKSHVHENATVLAGITAENVTTWNMVTSKAAQSDLDAAVARIAANEAGLASFVEASETEINNLFA